MARFDSAELVAIVQRRGRVPIASGDWTTANILAALSEEADGVFPLVVASRGEYNLLTASQSVVSGTSRYRIPKHALDNAVREAWMEDADGIRVRLTELSGEELTAIRADMDATGTPKHFWFDSGSIVLYPVPDTNSEWTLKVRYHPRPNALVATTSAFIADSSITTTTMVSATAAPTAWAAATKVDVIRGSSPFDIMVKDVALSAVSGDKKTLTFAAGALPADLAVGDYVAATGESPLLNMPESLHLPVVLRTAASIIGAQGDKGGAEKLVKEAQAKEAAALVALAPRAKAPTKKLNSRRWF